MNRSSQLEILNGRVRGNCRALCIPGLLHRSMVRLVY